MTFISYGDDINYIVHLICIYLDMKGNQRTPTQHIKLIGTIVGN